MLKKAVVLTVVCLLLLVMAVPAAAMLKVLEPKLSEELREVAKTHLVRTENIADDAIDIQEGWVQEYWNIGVDVYNIVAVIDKGLASEREIQIPIRIDQKVVLSDAEMTALKEEDKALAPDEPVMRILMAPDEAGAGNQSVEQPGVQPANRDVNRLLNQPVEEPVSHQPLNVLQDPAIDSNLPFEDESVQTAANDINTTAGTDARSAAESAQAETAGYMIYYLAAGAIALLFLGTTYAFKRCRA